MSTDFDKISKVLICRQLANKTQKLMRTITDGSNWSIMNPLHCLWLKSNWKSDIREVVTDTAMVQLPAFQSKEDKT